MIPRGRMLGWFVFVGVLVVLAYAASAAADDTPDDLLYRWSTVIGGLVQYAVILAIALSLMRGVPRAAFGFKAPGSWGQAIGLILGGLVVIGVVGALLDKVLNAGEEQGLVPDTWDSSRAAPFVANFVVVAVAAPVVEELLYRGLGFSAVRSYYSPVVAIVVTGVAFGLSHGLLAALPILSLFGIVLATVRHKTDSIYPGIALHALFNSIALLAGVL